MLPRSGGIDAAGASACLVDASRAMRQVRALATRAAAGDAKVLITGESGVGKDVVAQYIHAHSNRATRAFVAVNCAAIADSLLETELFGHARGSFTGAYRDRMGRLEAAHRGTIFLDEIGEMSLQMQAHLLRFLESGEIQPVGSIGGPLRVDARIICATNRDLNQLVAAGAFRSDLLYRIKVLHIHVPPLRERKEDLPGLSEHAAGRTGRPICFTDAARQAMARYRWPGNVRELHNVIEQLAWMSESTTIDVGDLPEVVRFASSDGLMPRRERRRRLADELYSTLVDGHYTFWGHIHPLLLKRDITRHDLRQLVSLGLAATRGNYRALLKLFGMAESDYKRFMNFLAAHECTVDFRQFRTPSSADTPLQLPVLDIAHVSKSAGRRTS
jgi:two-component system response regulator HydG